MPKRKSKPSRPVVIPPPAGAVGTVLFDHLQADLPAKIGVTIEDIRQWRDRNLVEGLDWARKNGAACWSLASVRLLETALHIAGSDLPCGPQKSPPAQASGVRGLLSFTTERMLTVFKPARFNKSILMAHLPGKKPTSTADLLRVLVKDASVYRPGTQIPARHVKDDLWRYDRSLQKGLQA